ncbi:DUF6314 family protein [Tateyamaria pelophila]|uniref:DUF6314 family protein n=1 Tax=Tateyamaria pelophila TaxID=328415 RepID=UPI001CBC1306|nr:DUF6314 family protein [Tateyamaria pelophila]
MKTSPGSTMRPEVVSVRRVLRDFEGTWQIARDIRPEVGPPARFEGQGVWTPQANGLAYLERGFLTLEGVAPMQAERRYYWQHDLSVFFEDGRFFHQVPAAGGQTEHWCDPDQYKVTYDFSDWPGFEVSWDVRGPRKAYRMNSRFTPLARP